MKKFFKRLESVTGYSGQETSVLLPIFFAFKERKEIWRI